MDGEGDVARDIWQLTLVLSTLGSVVFVLVLVVLALALQRGRDDRSSDEPAPEPSPESDLGLRRGAAARLIVGGGVVLPAVVLTVVLAWTLETMLEIPTEASPDAVTYIVTGHQWSWEFVHAESGVTVRDELHAPIEREIELRVTSADVVHSFWVPGLAGKIDALPERTNTLILEVPRTGRYRGQCAEFCGLEHSLMGIVVVGHTAADFEEWLTARAGPDVEVGAGG